VAKEKHHAVFRDCTRQDSCEELIFDNTIEGFEKPETRTWSVSRSIQPPEGRFRFEPTAKLPQAPGGALDQMRGMGRSCWRYGSKGHRRLSEWPMGQNDERTRREMADLIAQGNACFVNIPLMTPAERARTNALKRRLKKREHASAHTFATISCPVFSGTG